MKHLILFEKYKYLSKDDSDKIEKIAIDFINNINIIERINNLKIFDFEKNSFNYFEIFTSLLSISKSGLEIYSEGNIYYFIDTFCKNNNMNFSTPSLRNSLNKILLKIFKNRYKIKFDKRLIELFEKYQKEYIYMYKIHHQDINDVVKKSCEWILKSEKYNL